MHYYLLFSVKINNGYFEFESGVWGDGLSISLGSIGEVWWNSEHRGLSLLQGWDTVVPSCDHLPFSKVESEWLPSFQGRVKDLPIGAIWVHEPTLVVDSDSGALWNSFLSCPLVEQFNCERQFNIFISRWSWSHGWNWSWSSNSKI